MTSAEHTQTDTLQLSQLGKRMRAVILGIGDLAEHADGNGETAGSVSERRLRQIGFEEDKEVEILHTGPFGSDPLAVRVDRMVLAIRKAEAALITVKAR